MALSIQQDQKYMGSDRWQWSVWLDGTQEELDSVEYVTYILDPTFHSPVREVGDRTTNFRLSMSAWGTFTMHANIRHRRRARDAVPTPSGFALSGWEANAGVSWCAGVSLGVSGAPLRKPLLRRLHETRNHAGCPLGR